jgi:hypothetical protein
MDVKEKDPDMFHDETDDSEASTLLEREQQWPLKRTKSYSTHLFILYIINISLSATIIVLTRLLLLQRNERSHDPSLGVYCMLILAIFCDMADGLTTA